VTGLPPKDHCPVVSTTRNRALPRQRSAGSDHVVGIAAVPGDAGNLRGDPAGEELAATAGVAVPAVPAMPADPDPLAWRPAGDARAHRIDEAGDLMPGDTGVLNAWPVTLLGERVAVTDATGFDLDPHRAGAGLRDLAFRELQGSLRTIDLHDTHLRHASSDGFFVKRGAAAGSSRDTRPGCRAGRPARPSRSRPARGGRC
jgi:hypothetical protein